MNQQGKENLDQYFTSSGQVITLQNMRAPPGERVGLFGEQ